MQAERKPTGRRADWHSTRASQPKSNGETGRRWRNVGLSDEGISQFTRLTFVGLFVSVSVVPGSDN